ncbi:MAG: alpha-hydroxy-acid oxidizing protein [Eubacterium sp.]|nr:alpha-hydroxy-acid oxidizing protein [Eubacterium sp.]
MDYKEVLKNAAEIMGPNCKVCPVCNGVACKGKVPGVGGIGTGAAFTNCVEYLSKIKIMMDAVHEDFEADTGVELFGRKFSAPVFVAPIGGMGMNYNGYLTEEQYTRYVVYGALDAGILAFTGDGPSPTYFPDAMAVVRESGGLGIPTVKPWEREKVLDRISAVVDAKTPAFAMDIDSAALVNLRLNGTAAYTKSTEELAEFVQAAQGIPFIVKGVMTADSAERCADAGAYGIVISSHGGRIIQDTLPTISVIKEIRERVGDRLKLFVDGGIRTGADVFKCLALGADAVLIGRPFAIAAHGGGQEGVKVYAEHITFDLKETMRITGCRTLADIKEANIRNLNSF